MFIKKILLVNRKNPKKQILKYFPHFFINILKEMKYEEDKEEVLLFRSTIHTKKSPKVIFISLILITIKGKE